jgi:phosphatidylglycerophosphatase C
MNAGTDATARGLAVFDLDGTITRHDTFLPYLRGWLRRHPDRRRLSPAVAALIRFLLNGRDRGQLKSDLIRAWMGGASRAAVESWSAEFVSGLDDAELCPGARAAIARHRASGDRLVLLSASVDLYVPGIGERLGFDEAICTEIAWQGRQLDGALATPNRRAEEKRLCIAALRRRYPGAHITAYGNARSDFAHLAAVDRAVLVNAGPRLRRAAADLGICAEDWCNKSSR